MAKKKPTAFILDSSVALAWFFEDEDDEYANAVQDSFPAVTAHAPALWPLEVANALLVGERRKRTTEAKVTPFLTLLGALSVSLDSETASRATSDTLHLARAHGLSTYDATYLELALRLGLPLATLDDRLKGAAKAAGVALFEP